MLHPRGDHVVHLPVVEKQGEAMLQKQAINPAEALSGGLLRPRLLPQGLVDPAEETAAHGFTDGELRIEELVDISAGDGQIRRDLRHRRLAVAIVTKSRLRGANHALAHLMLLRPALSGQFGLIGYSVHVSGLIMGRARSPWA